MGSAVFLGYWILIIIFLELNQLKVRRYNNQP